MSSLAARRPVTLIAVAVVAGTLALAAFAAHLASPLVAAGLLGVILFVVLLRWPGMALSTMAALSFTIPLQIGTGSDVFLTTPVVLIPLVVVAWIADGLRAGTLRLPASPVTLPLCLFVVGVFLSLIAGNAYWDPLVPRAGNLLLVQLAQCAIVVFSAAIFLAAAGLGQRQLWLQRATYVFLVVGGIAAVLGYMFTAPAHALGWPIARLSNAAMFWTWLGAMAAGQLFFNRQLSVPARIGLVAALCAAVWAVWVRQPDWLSGWLPFTLAVISAIWLRLWRRNRLVGILGLVMLVLVAVLLYPLVFRHIGGEMEVQMSWGGRRLLYQAVLDLVKEHPILGLGPASYRHYAYMRWLSLGVGRALYVRPAVSSHNNFIDVYAQFGLLGLFFFLWFLGATGLTGWRLLGRHGGDFRDGYVAGAISGLIGTAAAMMLVDWFLPFVYNIGFAGFRTSALAWMFLGGLVALDQAARREPAREPSDERWPTPSNSEGVTEG